jgi:hypothetical protein
MMCSAPEAIACVHGHTSPQARDARDVQPLLGFRHRAAHDHIVHVVWIESGRAAQDFADHGGGHFVRPDGFQCAVRGFADGSACGGDDYSVLHE